MVAGNRSKDFRRVVRGRTSTDSQLIDATTDKQLWARTFDRELNDVFVIQSEVAENIAAARGCQAEPGELDIRVPRDATGDRR